MISRSDDPVDSAIYNIGGVICRDLKNNILQNDAYDAMTYSKHIFDTFVDCEWRKPDVQEEYVFPKTTTDILTGFCRKAAQNESGEYIHVVSKDGVPVKLVYDPDFVPAISFKNGSSITTLNGNSDVEDNVIDEISQADLDAILNGTYGE